MRGREWESESDVRRREGLSNECSRENEFSSIMLISSKNPASSTPNLMQLNSAQLNAMQCNQTYTSDSSLQDFFLILLKGGYTIVASRHSSHSAVQRSVTLWRRLMSRGDTQIYPHDNVPPIWNTVLWIAFETSDRSGEPHDIVHMKTLTLTLCAPQTHSVILHAHSVSMVLDICHVIFEASYTTNHKALPPII